MNLEQFIAFTKRGGGVYPDQEGDQQSSKNLRRECRPTPSPSADSVRTALSEKRPAGSERFGVGCGHGSDLLATFRRKNSRSKSLI
jgi:hypothetical protein